jgi:hypothetical protein
MKAAASVLTYLARRLRALPGIVGACAVISLATACSPKVGSEDWCLEMRDKPKNEWLAEEVKAYFVHCIEGEPID